MCIRDSRIFAISRDAGSPAPKTCQLSPKPIGKVRGGGLDPTILDHKKASSALKPHQALSFGLALARKQPRRRRCATRIFEILTPTWSAKIAKIAKSKEISMIWAFSTRPLLAAHEPDLRVLTSRRKVAKSFLKLQVGRGRGALPARQQKLFIFRPLFSGSWSGALPSLWEGWPKKARKGPRKHFSRKAAF